MGIAQNKVRSKQRQPRPTSGTHPPRLTPTMPTPGGQLRWSGELSLGSDTSLDSVSSQGSYSGLVYPGHETRTLLVQGVPLVNTGPSGIPVMNAASSGIPGPSGYIQRYSTGLSQHPHALGVGEQSLYEQGLITRPPEYRGVCVCVCLSVCLSVCLCICLFVHSFMCE